MAPTTLPVKRSRFLFTDGDYVVRTIAVFIARIQTYGKHFDKLSSVTSPRAVVEPEVYTCVDKADCKISRIQIKVFEDPSHIVRYEHIVLEPIVVSGDHGVEVCGETVVGAVFNRCSDSFFDGVKSVYRCHDDIIK